MTSQSAGRTARSTQETLQDFVGRIGQPQIGRDDVNPAMIRHWCMALEDRNPIYVDEQRAKKTGLGGVIAPPAMMQAWTMPDYGSSPPAKDAVAELYALLDSNGYVGIVATNSEQDYLKPLKIGDRVTSTKTINMVSEAKTTKLGEGHFITSNIEYVNQRGETVGRQLHRVLKYRPPSDRKLSPREQTLPRPRPNVTQDTAFYFEAAGQRRLVIQGCDVCHQLQHPPTAACRACGSLELSPVQMSGRGKLFSYTIIHAPVIPPFEAPYNVILVDLEEGPRIVSELRDIAPADIRIGMDVEVDFLDLPPDFGLPVFRRAAAPVAVDEGAAATAKIGDAMPPLSIPLTRSKIIATAIATRDFQLVHHDHEVAQARGSEDIFMNIITTQGLVARFVTDWAGADATLRKIAITLGTPNYPGDTMVMSGSVVDRRPGEGGTDLDLAVTGNNSRGSHVAGTVTIHLPENGDHAR